MERGDLPVEQVQVADEPPHPLVGVPPQQVPGERSVVVPLLPLAELTAHEEELLPRLAVHVPEEHPQVGELLPFVAGLLAEERLGQRSLV